MEGRIFDIQRFSIYDGQGIRTNVFFKGCNLRCLWCHNPESQSPEPQRMVFTNQCVGCGACLAVCPNAFSPDCTACGRCVPVCEHKARKISGQTVTADEVVKAVLRDKPFYDTSGGGVTLSGGEPLLQPDFALAILSQCKEKGIHTAIETAGHVPYAVFEKLLPFLDFIFFDIKCISSDLHRRLTGVGNERILENAALLKESGVPLRFRMPVIPTLNDGETDAVAAFAGDTPLELMAYHNTGCSKYTALGRDYALPDITPPTKEFMTELADSCGALYEATGLN